MDKNEVDFTVSAKYWQLEKIYIDLAAVKGKGLTPLEKTFLQGLLCGYSPAEIAACVYRDRSSNSVRVYLSKGLYKYIQELLFMKSGAQVRIKHWGSVTNLLSQAGYKKETQNFVSTETKLSTENTQLTSFSNASDRHQDWEEKIDVRIFVGREEEINLLTNWIVRDRCRLVAILGMAGLGKTTLAVKVIEQIEEEFDFIIWRSLRGAPPLEEILAGLIQFFEPSTNNLPQRTETRISLLMEKFRATRCLLVLNQFEEILSGKELTNKRELEYGEFLGRLARESHLSCCLLTSREKPKEFSLLEQESLVRGFCLSGLKSNDSLKLLHLDNLVGSEREKQLLVSLYANNPLTIKMVSLTIKNIFNKNITEFLSANTLILSDIRNLLDEQFDRLSEIEKQLLYTMVVNQKLMELRGVGKELTLDLLPQEQLEALQSLQRRFPLGQNSFSLQQEPLLRTYILEKLLERVSSAIDSLEVARLVRHILCETLLKERQSK